MRLKQVMIWGDTTIYAYNGDGDRIGQTVNGTLTTYVIDTATPLTMVLAETTNGQTIRYWHGLDVISQSDGSQTEYFGYDGLGSVRQLNDAGGSVGLAQTFDPYGNGFSKSGTAISKLGYSGEQTDSNGFVYLRARFYNPASGRFLNTDPSRQERNPYSYGFGNPIFNTDPSGLSALKQFAFESGMMTGTVTSESSHTLKLIARWLPCNNSSNNSKPSILGVIIQNELTDFGLNFEGNWTDEQKAIVLDAAKIIESRLKQVDLQSANKKSALYGDPPSDFCYLCTYKQIGMAWRVVFGFVKLVRVSKDTGYGAETFAPDKIEFYDDAFTGSLGFSVHLPIHEFGHLFGYRAQNAKGVRVPYQDMQDANVTVGDIAIFGGTLRTDYGYQVIKDEYGNIVQQFPWQQHSGSCCGEDFADMFLNWTLNSFANDQYGAARYNWMNSNMPRWIGLTVTKWAK
jgi:RHS repeat-associated protein